MKIGGEEGGGGGRGLLRLGRVGRVVVELRGVGAGVIVVGGGSGFFCMFGFELLVVFLMK